MQQIDKNKWAGPWLPTNYLRWVERQEIMPEDPPYALSKTVKVLQQRMRRKITSIHGGPAYKHHEYQWQDVPLVKDETTDIEIG